MSTMIRSARAARLSLFTGLLLTAACTRNDLLSVETPDQITPEAAGNPSGAAALRVSALGNFANFYSGDNAGGGVGMNIATGLLGDEMVTSRGGTEHIDTRAVNENTFPTTVWSLVGTSQTQLIRARKALEEFAPEGATTQSQMAQMQILEGFVYVITGEAYCNGVPIGNADDLAPATTNVSNAELFTRAVAAFDSGAALAPSDQAMKNLAAVGKGRALVNLKQFAQAATAVAAVPTSFTYQVQHSRTTIINDVYDWMVGTKNFGVVNREGTNGLDYLTANDPRIQFSPTPVPGQDGSPTISPTKYPNPDSPVILANGIEARLIEAEAALDAGNAASYLSLLNAVRTTVSGLAPLTDPATPTDRVNLLFRERAFWFWLTSHRLGDMRRLVRQYSRPAESVFPTGPYFKGGVYGTDVNLIPSNAERNNPSFSGCTDRVA
jgi:starch-binding outer membrane protein, SusD/RagB family